MEEAVDLIRGGHAQVARLKDVGDALLDLQGRGAAESGEGEHDELHNKRFVLEFQAFENRLEQAADTTEMARDVGLRLTQPDWMVLRQSHQGMLDRHLAEHLRHQVEIEWA